MHICVVIKLGRYSCVAANLTHGGLLPQFGGSAKHCQIHCLYIFSLPARPLSRPGSKWRSRYLKALVLSPIMFENRTMLVL